MSSIVNSYKEQVKALNEQATKELLEKQAEIHEKLTPLQAELKAIKDALIELGHGASLKALKDPASTKRPRKKFPKLSGEEIAAKLGEIMQPGEGYKTSDLAEALGISKSDFATFTKSSTMLTSTGTLKTFRWHLNQ